MHEVGIVQSLIDQAARAAGDRSIKQVHVALGELSDVSRDALDFYFEELRAGTPLAAATLVVRTELGRAQCAVCGREFGAAADIAACPHCGSFRLKVTVGDRLVLEAIDVA